MSRARLHPDGEWKDISAERYRQRLEAERIITLAWDAGAFDDLDTPPTGTTKDTDIRSRPEITEDELVEFKTERGRQILEAKRVLGLAWEAGFFDDLDPGPGLEVRPNASVSLTDRVASRAIELLAGQYPEVRVKARPRARFGWRTDPRPRCRLEITLRSWRRLKMQVGR